MNSNCITKSRFFCNIYNNVDINIANQICWIYCRIVYVILHLINSKFNQNSFFWNVSIKFLRKHFFLQKSFRDVFHRKFEFSTKYTRCYIKIDEKHIDTMFDRFVFFIYVTVFVQKHWYIDVQKKFIVNLYFSIDAIKSTYESMKISTINFTLFLFANFDIFNSIRFHQNLKKKRFNQIIIFIQHFEQCQHLYCESKLLEWMKIIFCNFVDIWFKNQSNFIFLHDFDIFLTKTFFTSIFNTMFVLSFSIFAIKLLCAIEKKSIVINLFVSSELQISIATSKQKFEYAMIFETIISSKILRFSFIVSEIISKSMKNTLIRRFVISSKSIFF